MHLRRTTTALGAALLAAGLLGTAGCGGSRACERWDYVSTQAPSADAPRAALDAYLASAPGDPPRTGWKERGVDSARSYTASPHWRIGVEQRSDGTWYVANASSC
ncbi:hypothetical protein CLV35_2700 [Motilibacter peucedani]|uniref:Lipoprotein n=1 Tax=Motilibacter peucedani TaxID=598650 RepID=A0A420XM70_9ACTN|nr:hypothetical protein [Motilibacter peucedani]RKS72456.1 hypothetical protein CLV35_2700 [Motilibacter peucedani]